MKIRKLACLLAFVPVLGMAQSTVVQGPSKDELSAQGPLPTFAKALRCAQRETLSENSATRAVLLANCPKAMAEADWLRLMAKPVNRSLYPLRITQAMLDTLDASKLDPGYQYVMVR
jgi:hypothetical protein